METALRMEKKRQLTERNMIKKLIKLLLFIFLFNSNGIASSVSPETENIVVIVGKPYKVKDSPNKAHYEKVSIGSKYIVYFKDYRIVSGELKYQNILKVELQASSKSVLTYPEEIYVVIKKSSDKVLEALLWDIPKYSICLPIGEISKHGLEKEFVGLVAKDGIKCKGIYSHGNN